MSTTREGKTLLPLITLNTKVKLMSSNSILAIASITAILKSLLNNELVHRLADIPIGDAIVTTLPPDRILTGGEERAQLNLYLYRVTPNAGRYHHRPSTPEIATTSADQRPLALDLHYLLSAYAEHDFQAEVLLSCAMYFFQQTPVLTGETLCEALASLSANSIRGGPQPILEILSSATFIEQWQLQALKITPEFLSMEDLSRLWSSLQARSRLAVTYQVSTVFIGSDL
jgi:hypothetical protein